LGNAKPQVHEKKEEHKAAAGDHAKHTTDFFRILYSKIPQKIRIILENEAQYAGIDPMPYKAVACSFAASILIAIAIFPILGLFEYSWVFRTIASIVAIVSGVFIPYVVLSMMAESRRTEIEAVLPDMLLLTSSNVKSGLTIDKALLFSARPEFGILGKEIKHVALQIFGGSSVADAFSGLATKIKSQILNRTIMLLLEGLRSGGAVAQLLEESAADIRNTEMLQREVRSSVMTYMIFIFLAAVLGAPFLFGVSTFLVLTTIQLWGGGGFEIPEEAQQGQMVTISAPDVDMGAFNTFVVLAIMITTVFASMLISMIQTGKIGQAFRYLPGFVIISLVIFFSTKAVLLGAFGSLVGL
jgi:archaeal flagellar protein FlaJ